MAGGLSRAMQALRIDDLVEGDERRLLPRAPLGKPGTLRIGDGPATPVQVRDLTRDGCRIETDLKLASGLAIGIGLANVGTTSGKLIWAARGSYGCAFDAPLPAGSVTAACESTNVVDFPGEQRQPPVKWTTGSTVALIAGSLVLSWGAVAGLAILALR